MKMIFWSIEYNIFSYVILANASVESKSLLHCLEQVAEAIGFYVNVNKTEFMCFKQEGAIFTLSVKILKKSWHVHIPR